MQALKRFRKWASLSLVHLKGKLFDWSHGVDTAGTVPLKGLKVIGVHANDGVEYGPILEEDLALLMSCVPEPDKCTFVDFGSGKGRGLLLASHYAFRSIVGVEFAEELHKIAVRNTSTYRGRKRLCQSLTCVHCDAADFEIPKGPLVLFFYNPFRATVMTKVVENIRRSLAAAPRDIWILCYGRWTLTNLLEQIENIEPIMRTEFHKAYRIVNRTCLSSN
jgi:hypothetical protein